MCDRSSDPTEHDAARERPSALDVDAELLAHAILGGSSYPAHREAAERILARLTEPDAGEGTER